MSASLLGVYGGARQAADTIAALQTAGFAEIEAYSPTPDHTLDAAIRGRRSVVNLFVLAGGLLGCFVGFAFPIYTVLEWPLITGGKPLISIPSFVIIAFELTILLSAIAGVVGFLILVGLPRMRGRGLYDARFTEDRCGVQVTCTPDRVDAARAILMAHGAEDLHVAT